MSAAWSAAVGACLLVGLFFNTMGVLGILRFPDVYTRLHADTKATTFGSIFIALAAVLVAGREAWAAGADGWGAWANVAVHIGFAVVVLLVTNATGGHAIARAAWRAGHRPAGAVVDALAAAGPRKPEGERRAEEARLQEVAAECSRVQRLEGVEVPPDGPETPEVPEARETAEAAVEPMSTEVPEPVDAPVAEEAAEPVEVPEPAEAGAAPEIPEASEPAAEPETAEAPVEPAPAGVAEAPEMAETPETGAEAEERT